MHGALLMLRVSGVSRAWDATVESIAVLWWSATPKVGVGAPDGAAGDQWSEHPGPALVLHLGACVVAEDQQGFRCSGF